MHNPSPKHTKKIIAPVIIVLWLIADFIAFAIICTRLAGEPLHFKLFGILLPLAIVGICIYVLVERIKEIKSGEEDDLSKYWLYFR